MIRRTAGGMSKVQGQELSGDFASAVFDRRLTLAAQWNAARRIVRMRIHRLATGYDLLYTYILSAALRVMARWPE